MDFEKDVLEQSKTKTVLVDFFAQWCGPCKTMKPIVEAIAAENNDKLSLVQIDIDEHDDLASKFGIRSVPTFLVFTNGELVGRLNGGTSRRDQFEEVLRKYNVI